ncbi:MAG: hypothetical protein E3J72_08250 [Planctomycetota bacterium]|nr:MAG: hypothetical protein E3J72_08250 [Planctomycetota bacterium]
METSKELSSGVGLYACDGSELVPVPVSVPVPVDVPVLVLVSVPVPVEGGIQKNGFFFFFLQPPLHRKHAIIRQTDMANESNLLFMD